MRNIAAEKYSLVLTKPELSTIPGGGGKGRGSSLYKRYEGQFKSDMDSKIVRFESKQEFQMAKFSHFPEVRRKFFLEFSNNNQANT
jgi:hypothetical protein